MRPGFVLGATLVVLALVVAAACNDDGDDGQPSGSPQPSPAATASPAATPGLTPAPTVPPGTREAVPPDNIAEFLQGFEGLELTLENCLYDEESGLMNCSEVDLGFVQLEPPVPGSDVECRALLAEGELVGVSCTSQDPYFASMYELAPE